MDAPVLVTGATGYIGGRLLRRFEEGGRAVRCLVRQNGRLRPVAPTTEVVRGDCLDEASLDRALSGVRVAYYLVHSMDRGADFAGLDRRAAENFGRAAARAGVRRIIYLGGLTDGAAVQSTHLRSRAETGEVLRVSGVPVIELRASIVIGAGSLSFEMIQALVERLPVMVCPRWIATKTQPIAIDDVLAYLDAARGLPDGINGIYEIGGPEVVSFGDLMRTFARLRGLRRWLLPVPVLTPHLSGLWLALVTPAQARVGRALVGSLKNATVVRSTEARDVFGIEPMPLDAAISRAIDNGAHAGVRTDTRTVVVDARAADSPPARAVFAYRSVVPGRAADVFRWHERPEALLDLIPSRRLVRIERRTGGLENGGTIVFSVGLGPVRVRWRARHYGYIRGRQFCDEQVSGPFKLWRHTHRIEPIGTAQSLYEDRVEYAVPGGRLAQRLTEPVLRRLLARAFAQRHHIVRAAMTRVLLLSLSPGCLAMVGE